MNYIDAILYINLSHRPDRNDHVLMEIGKICNDSSKIHRIDAIKKEPGALGCGLSHIKALEFALHHSQWNTILILEDDFTFKSNNSNEINNDIELLFKNAPQMDVGLLASNLYFLKYFHLSHFRIKKVFFSQTASAYIIKKDYIPKLLSNFCESVQDMIHNGVKHENNIDQAWGKLQKLDNWYVIFPPIGHQYDNYSDIEKRHTSYNC